MLSSNKLKLLDLKDVQDRDLQLVVMVASLETIHLFVWSNKVTRASLTENVPSLLKKKKSSH